MTQAGGKLVPELHERFAGYAQEKGKNFVVMYGAAEATAGPFCVIQLQICDNGPGIIKNIRIRLSNQLGRSR